MKKSQKKFQKYFSYQPNKETNPGGVKPRLALFATAPRARLPEKNLRLLGKRNKISFSLANLTFLFKKNWHSLGKGSKSSFSLVSLVFRYGARRLGPARTRENRKKSERQLSQPFECRLVKLSCFGLLTFLATLIAVSAFAPVQPSSAEEILLANQSTGGSVSLTTSGNVNLSLEATSSGAVRTAQDTVTVSSSNTGYQLYLSTASDNNSLIKDGTDDTDINDIIPAGGGNTISSPAMLTDNSWGFALTQPDTSSNSGSHDVVENGFDTEYPTGDNSLASNKFTKVPIKGNDILIAKSNTTSTEILTNVYYGARVTTAQPSGLYKSTIVYTAISNSSTSNLASVKPTSTTQITGGFTITIATPSSVALDDLGTITVTIGGAPCTNPVAEKNDNGTGALNNVTCTAPGLSTGWHEVVVTFENSEETYIVNPGIEYQYDYTDTTPEILAITMIENDTTTGTLDLSDDLTMQQMTPSVCKAMKTASSTSNANKNYLLKDVRDNNTYKVAKLPDGNCWMTTNLMLGNTIINSGSITINSDNSDYSGTAFTISSSNVMASGKTNNWTSNDYDVLHIYARPASEKDGNGNSYGNLYNWYTATAKSGTYSLASGDAPYSLCPKNWRLPSLSGNGSYINLFQTPTASGGMGITVSSGIDTTNFGGTSSTVAKPPYSLPLAGVWHTGVVGAVGVGTTSWSSAALNSTAAYFININIDGFWLQAAGARYDGRSIRCVIAP